MYQKKREEIEACPLKYVFDLFGKKWNAWVYCNLANNGPLRYTELRNMHTDFTDAALSSILKLFLNNNIIQRISYDEIPPRVEYSLTEKGRSAIPFLQGMCQWSTTYNQNNPDYKMNTCSFCEFNTKSNIEATKK